MHQGGQGHQGASGRGGRGLAPSCRAIPIRCLLGRCRPWRHFLWEGRDRFSERGFGIVMAVAGSKAEECASVSTWLVGVGGVSA